MRLEPMGRSRAFTIRVPVQHEGVICSCAQDVQVDAFDIIEDRGTVHGNILMAHFEVLHDGPLNILDRQMALRVQESGREAGRTA